MSFEDLRTKFTWKMISDPLYGYVYFNVEVEEPIINSVLLQRLRYIIQLQTAHLVYPGAVHTRFQHSLGVMHLAGLMAEDAVHKIIALYGKEALEGLDPLVIIQAARLAGLLHDVGHAAFGHAFEYAVLWRGKAPAELSNHEKIGRFLIKHVIGEYVEKLDRDLGGLKELLESIMGEPEPKGVFKIFRWLVREGYYPADVLDFLKRDSYYAGTAEYGSIMHERLYKNTYPLINGKDAGLVLDRIALGEFKQYMRAKASMYQHVYYHSVCRSFDKILYDILEELNHELNLLDRVEAILRGDVRGYLELTDAFFYTVMMKKALYEDTRTGRLCRKLMIERKPEWKRVGREVSISATKGPEALRVVLKLVLDSNYKKSSINRVEKALTEDLKKHGLSEEDVWIDVVEITPLPRSTIYPSGEEPETKLRLYLGKRLGKKLVVSEELDIASEDLPLEVSFRVYVPRTKYNLDLEASVTRALINAVSSTFGIDIAKFGSILKSVYEEYRGLDYSRVRITA